MFFGIKIPIMPPNKYSISARKNLLIKSNDTASYQTESCNLSIHNVYYFKVNKTGCF